MNSIRTIIYCSILLLSLIRYTESAMSKSVPLFIYTQVLADSTRSYNMANQENDMFIKDLLRSAQYAQCRTNTNMLYMPPLPPEMALMDYTFSYQMLNRICNCSNTTVSGRFYQTALQFQDIGGSLSIRNSSVFCLSKCIH